MIQYTHVSRAGGARYVFELVRHLGKVRDDVTLVCPMDFQFWEELRECEGVRVQPLLPSPVSAEGRKVELAICLLRQAFVGLWSVLRAPRNERLVHANFPGLTVLAMPTLALWRIVGKKVVFTVHDVIPHRWLFPRFARRLEIGILWACYHVANHLIVHHSDAKRELEKRFGIRPDRISIIPHGSFSLGAEPLPMPTGEAERVVLLFGAIRENKGIHLAIKAVQQLRREGHGVILKICGPSCMSEQLYWERCKELIASNPDGIIVSERYISDTELSGIIERSHFFLLPYTEFHSQSGVAALALSNGRPIIATQAGGLMDVVIPGKTGVVITGSTVSDVRNALHDAIRMSDDELRAMASSCSTLFRTEYSWSRIATLHSALYNHVAPERNAGQLRAEVRNTIDD